MSHLRKLRISGSSWDNRNKVLEVSSTHALIQAAGYLKYLHGQDGFVFFRGQEATYDAMRPALHRGISSTSGMKKRENHFSAYLASCRGSRVFVNSMPDYAQEGILQHYGVATKWIDLVDNIWVALWFACHKAQTHGGNNRYLHFERRTRKFPPPQTADQRDFAYVVAMTSGPVTFDPSTPGRYLGKQAEVVDLRIAAPSIYVRPHAQHGVVMRRRGYNDFAGTDMAPLVVGTLRVELGTALDWLGSGGLLSVRNLFPPPIFDQGYNILLSNAPTPPVRALNCVSHIGA